MKLSENYKLAMEAGYEKARKEFLEMVKEIRKKWEDEEIISVDDCFFELVKKLEGKK